MNENNINYIVNSYLNNSLFYLKLSKHERKDLFKLYKSVIIRNSDILCDRYILFTMLDFLVIADPILNNKEFLKRKSFKHHGEISVYEHSFRVALMGYNIARRLHLNNKKIRNIVIAGLLHDFYTTPWQELTDKVPLFKRHAFTHAGVALENAYKYFPELMNKRIADAIKKHMFPINIRLPRYIESVIITTSDKIVSLEWIKSSKLFTSLKYQFGFANKKS